MAIALGAVTFAFSRTHLKWLRYYLVFLVCYAVWLILSAWFIFQVYVLEIPLPIPSSAAATVRTVAAFIVLYVGPGFALSVAGVRIGGRGWGLLSIPVAFVFGLLAAYYASGSNRVLVVPNSFFNLYLALLFLVSALRLTPSGAAQRIDAARGAEGRLRTAFRPIVWFSFGAYLVLFAANVLEMPLSPGSALLGIGAGAGYCLLSSGLTILVISRHMRSAREAVRSLPPPVPAEFGSALGLSARECEIAEDVAAGLALGQIAERRVISPDAVESQVETLFRKCDVKNRAELIQLMESFRPNI